jgi:hypothetical protein
MIKRDTPNLKKRTKKTILIPIALHTSLKVIAAKTEKKIEEIICETLKKEIERNKSCL